MYSFSCVMCFLSFYLMSNLVGNAKGCIDYDLDLIYSDKILVKCHSDDFNIVRRNFIRHNVTFLYKVAHNVYAFNIWMAETGLNAQRERNEADLKDPREFNIAELKASRELNETELEALYIFGGKDAFGNNRVKYIQQGEQLFPNPHVLPLERHTRDTRTIFEDNRQRQHSGIVCSPFYDPAHHIEDAWKAGYTGKHIVIGIVDVGIDGDNQELKENIAVEYSHNFVDNNNNYAPEYYGNYPELSTLTNHGNACGTVAAGVCRNTTCDPCSCGVAKDAKIAVLKTGKVMKFRNWPYPAMESSAYAAALGYKHNHIAIYSCSWDFNKPFTKLDFASEKALFKGYKAGRKGLGSIYVFPAGRPGNGFSNSLYTIAVNTIGVNGTLPGRRFVNTATLVSAFGDGNTRHDSGMWTTMHSQPNTTRCSNKFSGSSSATALVSGIIAIALQANPNLTVRDIKHILVESSTYTGLEETPNFKQNAAGKFYHSAFGFGYPNVMEMIHYAQNFTPLPNLVHYSVFVADDRIYGDKRIVDLFSNKSIDIEQITVDVWMKLPKEENVVLHLISPSRTEALLLDTIINRPPEDVDVDNRLHVHTVFLVNAFWGEISYGNWSLELRLQNRQSFPEHDLGAINITFYGTQKDNLNITGNGKRTNEYDLQKNGVDNNDRKVKGTQKYKNNVMNNTCNITLIIIFSIALFENNF
ncbi:furin-like protease kpc-1 isoform X2 [Mya arenaria]|uniref:furin-like protease kpc-1 isoform X2 n=1 Tax=Mya arenaria TaxID=6604 RepID=UPI0022E8B3C1|nr:furin-like protease kpc-1 isoform X2 [Mya arenaria]